MQTYQERVVIEKRELDEKLTKLKEFCFGDGKIFATLNPNERDDLETQYTVMQEYSRILKRRIERF